MLGERYASHGDKEGPSTVIHHQIIGLRKLLHNVLYQRSVFLRRMNQQLEPKFFSLPHVHALSFRKPRNVAHQICPPAVCRVHFFRVIIVDAINPIRERELVLAVSSEHRWVAWLAIILRSEVWKQLPHSLVLTPVCLDRKWLTVDLSYSLIADTFQTPIGSHDKQRPLQKIRAGVCLFLQDIADTPCGWTIYLYRSFVSMSHLYI